MHDNTHSLTFSTLLIFAFLCLWHLAHYFPNSNEISKFIDTMSVLDPDWVSGLGDGNNIFLSRQQLFHYVIAPFLKSGGFFWATFAGRLICFGLLSVAFSELGKKLSLRPVVLLLALALFVDNQSLAAGEWMVLGVEPKVFSYALSLLALALFLSKPRLIYTIAFLSGLSLSFHPLVGGYMTLALITTSLCTSSFSSMKKGVGASIAFLVGGAFALMPILKFLLRVFDSNQKTEQLPASAIYVFLRTPHHLDPYSWRGSWWYYGAGCLVIIGITGYLLLSTYKRDVSPQIRNRVFTLILFALVTLVPFVLGLLIRNLDSQGTFLQLYLFRTADVIVPLITYLLCACLLEVSLHSAPPWVKYVPQIAVIVLFSMLVPTFVRDMKQLKNFPVGQRYVQRDWYELCLWVRRNTLRDALFLTNPKGSEAFPWLARRRMYGTFKQVPLSGGLREWKERMKLLSNMKEPFQSTGFQLSSEMSRRYRLHGDAYVQKLLSITGAEYFVTESSHKLSLPIVFKNAKYIIYSQNLSDPLGSESDRRGEYDA